MIRAMVRLAAVLCLTIAGAAAAAGQGTSSGREQDVRAIRHEIERIFQAFIDKDRQALADTHAANWRGYLTGSRTVIKGRDGYMGAVVGGGPMEPRGQGLIGYKIVEYDTVFYGETAVVSFVAEVTNRYGETTSNTRLTLIDVYVKEGGRWVQAASQTSLHPESQAALMSDLRVLDPSEKKSLLEAREAVWRAWFAGDRPRLLELLPPELITLEGGGPGFGSRDSILAASQAFAKSGAKLRTISFPRTDFQAYGNTVIIYTTFELETELNGKIEKEAGKATEVFVRRGERWLNTGWQLAPQH